GGSMITSTERERLRIPRDKRKRLHAPGGGVDAPGFLRGGGMPQSYKGERLSWGDAAFLYLEREGTPLNVASLFLFEGRIPLEDCIQLVESKLPLIPRYLQRVVMPPYNIGLPTWESAPQFNIRHHIREEKLKRGSEVELKQKTS